MPSAASKIILTKAPKETTPTNATGKIVKTKVLGKPKNANLRTRSAKTGTNYIYIENLILTDSTRKSIRKKSNATVQRPKGTSRGRPRKTPQGTKDKGAIEKVVPLRKLLPRKARK